MPNVEDLVTFSEAAREKECSRATLYRAVEDGRLNDVEVGDRRMLVRDESYERFEPKWRGGRVQKFEKESGRDMAEDG